MWGGAGEGVVLWRECGGRVGGSVGQGCAGVGEGRSGDFWGRVNKSVGLRYVM